MTFIEIFNGNFIKIVPYCNYMWTRSYQDAISVYYTLRTQHNSYFCIARLKHQDGRIITAINHLSIKNRTYHPTLGSKFSSIANHEKVNNAEYSRDI